MEQHFSVAFPHARKCFYMGHGLNSILWHGLARPLVNMLLLACDPLRNTPDVGPLPAIRPILFQIHENEVLEASRITKPLADCAGSAQGFPGCLKRASQNNTPLGFMALPVELHRHIIDSMESMEEILILGLTCRYFWSIARKELNKYYRSLYGQLANQNIICFGQDIEPDDYPPGLFSDAQVKKLQKLTIRDMVMFETNLNINSWELRHPFKLNHFALPGVSAMAESAQSPSYEAALLWLRFDAMNRQSGIEQDYAWRAVHDERYLNSELYIPTNQQWILRNLTTKEFVRSEAIALKPEFIHGPYIDHLGFAEALLCRISWTSRSSHDPAVPGSVYRGVWAGHRFDIVPLARHRAQTGAGQDWSDASSEVAREIAKIYEDGFGPNWREKITKTSLQRLREELN